MIQRVSTFFGALLLVSCLEPAGVAGAASSGDLATQIGEGRQLFITSCANCHGATGDGGHGPALASRNLDLERIRDIVLNGRPGTPMPSFRTNLDARSLAALLAYVVQITSDGRLPQAPIASETLQQLIVAPTTISVPMARGSGAPSAGESVFFDATNLHSCRMCHSYKGKGGPIGADLAQLNWTPDEIYAYLTGGQARASTYPVLSVTMNDGTSWSGIEDAQTETMLQIFDLSSIPPVKRSLRKSDVANIATALYAPFNHTSLSYSHQEQLDVSSYIGKSAPSQ